MKTLRKLVVASILTLSLTALALGSYASYNVFNQSQSNLFADTSGQPNEWDVGTLNTPQPNQLADTSGQPNEWDVG